MVNVTNAPAQSSPPASSTLPDTLLGVQTSTTQYNYASPSGTVNNVVSGIPSFVGNARLTVTLAAGSATWTGLSAGSDNQHITLWNSDAANTLTLAVKNSGSLAQNQFNGTSVGYLLSPGFTIGLIYYAGSVKAWVVR